MIYTVTVNPSVDYVVQMEEFQPGMVNRASSEAVFSGGKGINVSMILQNLGVSNRALGFLAGFTGDFIEADLQRHGCQTDFVRLEQGFSRINVKLKGQEGGEINGGGPAVNETAVQALSEKINTLQKGDILILSGSVPPSLPKDFYERILDLLKGRGIEVVVDAAGEALLKALRYEPFLIKPNHQELEELAESRLFTRAEIIAQGKRLQEMGAKNVLISLAAEGALLLTAEGEVLFGEAPRGKLIHAVGAGDSMVGGFVAGWLKEGSYRQALQWGIAAGSATAFCEALASGEEIRRLYDETIHIVREEG
nr:1-phosphofructokinase [uncultured Anaerotignum sp.]